MERPYRGPGVMPVLAGAFAAGVWFAGAHATTVSTALAASVFPWGLLALLAARRGLRFAALLLLGMAFAGAGLLRGSGASLPGPEAGPGPPPGPSACFRALGERGLEGPTDRAPATLEIEGLVDGVPAFYANRGRVAVRVDRVRRKGAWRPVSPLGISLALPGELRPLPGDRILATVVLDEPAIDLPGAAGRRGRLLRYGIPCVARLDEGRLAVIEPGRGPLPAIERLRRALLDAMRDRLEPGPAAALVAALAVGDREAIAPEQNDRFSASGLAHVLSVSGMHLGITVLGFYKLVGWVVARTPIASRFDPRRVAALLSLPAAPAYAALTGSTPPVLRAAIGTGLYLIAAASQRAPDGWSALGAAALALLAWDPASLWDPSFQLSFGACVGLLAVAPGLRAALPIPEPGLGASRIRRLVEACVAAAVTTAAATLATLPLTAIHFERFSAAALPANVVALPVGSLATVACAVAAVAGLIHPVLLGPPLAAAAPLCGLLDRIAGFFAAMPGARIPLPAPGPAEIATMLALAAFASIAGRRRRLGLGGMAAAVALLVLLRIPPGPDGRLHVEFLPVGQGDCTLLRLPDGGAILIDAGGEVRSDVDVAATRVLPQLASRGVRSLDALAVSHLHPDHVGGVPGVLAALPVREVWTSGRPLEGRFGTPLAEALRAHGIPRRILARGAKPIELGGVRIEILGPPDVEGLADDPLLEANDASLVLRVVHGDVAVLLPGDVEREGEDELLESDAPLEARLLKAPHHGSRTSSTAPFLRSVRPDHVVFCVGHRNQFKFPHREVVDRYEKAACTLHRTDRGPVHFVSDGKTIEHVP